MKPCLRIPLLLGGFASIINASSVASDVAIAPTTDDAGWSFRIEPYAWLTGLDGRTGVGPLVADFDQSFSDIFDNIDMAAALQLEARRGCLGILADGFYADLGDSASAPGPLYDEVGADIKQFIGELCVAWRIYESPNAFVDLYGGMRYNDLRTDFSGTPDVTGTQQVGVSVTDRLATTVKERVDSAVESRVDAFKAANATRRAEIEKTVRSAVYNEARQRVERDIVRHLGRVGRDHGLGANHRLARMVTTEVKAERLALARANAQLAAARLRASADARLRSEVVKARALVRRTEADLAAAIGTRIASALPTSASADVDWIDPILGIRAQYQLAEKWYIGGNSDIGGFGVGSDLTWTVEATVGYQFSERMSCELGYRYLDTDYQDGGFTYDVAQSGIFAGLNIRF